MRINRRWAAVLSASFILHLSADDRGAYAREFLSEPRPSQHLSLKMGQALTLAMPDAVSRVALADPTIADVTVINHHEIYLLGRQSGKTNLLIWNGNDTAHSVDIDVNMDLLPLQSALSHYFPSESGVQLTQLGNSIVVTGRVSDAVKAHQMMMICRAYLMHAGLHNSSASIPVLNTQNTGRGHPFPESKELAGSQVGLNISLINLMKVTARQQVRLEVKVAEVSKTWIQQWGVKVGLDHSMGAWSASLGSALSNGASPTHLALGLASGEASMSVSADRQDSLIKTLAEPSLLAMSGQEASFLAGGKVFIPVVQSTAQGAPLSSLEEKEFGIALKFTPTVLDGDRIHLKVAPEVSELNPQGLGLAASGVSGQAILPLFTTRRASTAVELRDGEAFAIGGLMQGNVNSSIQAFPWLSEIPILGALFRSTQFQKDETELLFVVTPHLVGPSDRALPLPTDRYKEPTQEEFFLEGLQQGQGPHDSSFMNSSGRSSGVLEYRISEGALNHVDATPIETDAEVTSHAYERYQRDEGLPLPMMGLPRTSPSLLGLPQ